MAYRAVIFTVIFNRVVIYTNNKARVREYFDLMFTALKNTTDEVFTFFYDDVVNKIKPRNTATRSTLAPMKHF